MLCFESVLWANLYRRSFVPEDRGGADQTAEIACGTRTTDAAVLAVSFTAAIVLSTGNGVCDNGKDNACG